MRRLCRLAFWVALVASFIMATLPHPPALPGAPSDKVQHILAFGVLAALGALAFPALPLIALVLGLTAFGGVIEIIQAIPALNRDSDVIDFVADGLAALTVGTIVRWTMRLRERER